jgi:uncharacterized protein
MKNAFIFHGTSGYPEENWFPWLKNELESQGYEVTVPHFPTPEGQSLEAWLDVMQPHMSKIGEQTTLIGHSLGGLFLLRLLERLERPVHASIFVAASAGVEPIKFYDADAAFSPGFGLDWSKIRANAGNAAVFHSDNDPYVSLGNGRKIANELGVKLAVIPNAGHFNKAAGYMEFPTLSETIAALDSKPV